MTQHPDLFAALAASFDPKEIRVRNQAGRQLSYITARTAMNRLDEVLGPENWWDDYAPNANSVLCRLTIRLPDGSTVTKQDAGGYAGMADQGDDDKSGFSDAFKRAAAKFGVARYLYRDGVPAFVRQRDPALETSAETTPQPAAAQAQTSSRSVASSRNGNSSAPKTGRAMFAWTKEQEQMYEVGLLKYLNNWGKLQEFPARMVEWDADQVALAHAEACRKLQSLQNGKAETYEEALAN